MSALDPTLVFLACLAVFLAMGGVIFALLINQARVLRARGERSRLLMLQHQRLRRMIDHLPMGALYLGGGEVVVNPRLLQMLPSPTPPLRHEEDLIRALFGARAPKVMRILAGERRRSSPRTLEAAYGPGFRRVLRATPFRGEDEEVWTLQDVTQEKQVLQQLLRAQKLECIGTMVSGISHEFGNLLMAIDGCAGALKRRSSADETSAEAVELILDATRKGESIIRQLLSFARTEVGHWSLFDLGELADRALQLIRPLFGRKYDLRLDREEVPLQAHGDASQIHQALLNLLLNARDAEPEGGIIRVQVRIASPEEAPSPHSWLVLEVIDQGCGIPKDACDRIFEPFYTTKGSSHGTGLGLSVTHGILEAHGGHIQVDSRPGEGTCMTLLLPGHPVPR